MKRYNKKEKGFSVLVCLQTDSISDASIFSKVIYLFKTQTHQTTSSNKLRWWINACAGGLAECQRLCVRLPDCVKQKNPDQLSSEFLIDASVSLIEDFMENPTGPVIPLGVRSIAHVSLNDVPLV